MYLMRLAMSVSNASLHAGYMRESTLVGPSSDIIALADGLSKNQAHTISQIKCPRMQHGGTASEEMRPKL